MDKDYSIFKFFSQIFMIYGITTGLFNIFCLLFGESAYGYSTIFSLGDAGVGVATSFQLLAVVTTITVLRFIFMTDILIKRMSLAARVVAMFSGAFLTMLAFVLMFDWLPADQPQAWIMFIVCFVVSCAVSTIISAIAERQENRKLEEALRRCKKEKKQEP